jgi:hypothetical protein
MCRLSQSRSASSHDLSLFATCKFNGIEPLQWLTDTLHKHTDQNINRAHELLPFNIKDIP